MELQRSGLVEEAARIVCEELVVDLRAAKLKAAERLGLPPRTPLPDNARVQQAALEYLQLFGGEEYRARLAAMRRLAIRLMRHLAPFQPRLVGGAVSGVVTRAHRLQLHLFADQAENLDVFLIEQGIAFEQGERDYRYADGGQEAVPLARLELDGLGVDLAVFPAEDLRRAPINPSDGQAYRRLDLAAAEKLLAIG